jgi:aminocarboxymuconate-semialdehyde decarboxylase
VSIDPIFFYYDADPEAGAAMSQAVNEGLKEFCCSSPDRLHWMATVPMQAPAVAVSILESAKLAGCVGVEVGTHIVDKRLDEPEFEPFWSAAERLQLPVMIHPSYNQPHPGLRPYHLQNVIGNQLETTLTIERLICSGVLDRHPGLTILIVHSGGYFAWQAGRLRHARLVRPELASAPVDPWAYIGQIQFDCLTHDRQALSYLLSRVGADNVLMGTDLPCDMATQRPWDDLCSVADQETARKVTETNVARVFGVN